MDGETLKDIVWIGSSRQDLKQFPEPIKSEIGYALFRAQEGKKHRKAKPLKGLSGVMEISSSYKTDTFRAIYAIKLGNCIYVLHAFKKKSHKGGKTPKPDMDVIRARLKTAQLIAKENKNAK